MGHQDSKQIEFHISSCRRIEGNLWARQAHQTLTDTCAPANSCNYQISQSCNSSARCETAILVNVHINRRSGEKVKSIVDERGQRRMARLVGAVRTTTVTQITTPYICGEQEAAQNA